MADEKHLTDPYLKRKDITELTILSDKKDAPSERYKYSYYAMFREETAVDYYDRCLKIKRAETGINATTQMSFPMYDTNDINFFIAFLTKVRDVIEQETMGKDPGGI